MNPNAVPFGCCWDECVWFQDGRVIIALLEMMPHVLDLILNTVFMFAVHFLIAWNSFCIFKDASFKKVPKITWYCVCVCVILMLFEHIPCTCNKTTQGNYSVSLNDGSLSRHLQLMFWFLEIILVFLKMLLTKKNLGHVTWSYGVLTVPCYLSEYHSITITVQHGVCTVLQGTP